ncbi:unnamed protein product [Citrullus colocynthis]|uniref:Uncharacterized protein n=1 Tax=Citrullus colocynthis TaxID=252529 RepID=A0ABP0YCV5_9ROSI
MSPETLDPAKGNRNCRQMKAKNEFRVEKKEWRRTESEKKLTARVPFHEGYRRSQTTVLEDLLNGTECQSKRQRQKLDLAPLAAWTYKFRWRLMGYITEQVHYDVSFTITRFNSYLSRRHVAYDQKAETMRFTVLLSWRSDH